MGKQSDDKPTIGCRVTREEFDRIDQLATELGQSRAEWLYGLIRQGLGESAPETVRSMGERIAALEKKLMRLAS